tara:strand:- start:10 stop:612 length:603 start_codon:yes stop_codon:yes gene_type:complete
MTLTTINQLTESKLFRHTHIIANLGEKGLKELTFLYILALYIMYNEPETHDKAVLYAKRTKSYRDFKEFYIGGTDLYLLINTLIGSGKKEWSSKWPFSLKTNPALIKKPLLLMFLDRLANKNIDREFIHRFLFNLQNTMNIQNSNLTSNRRLVQDWQILGHAKKLKVLTSMYSFLNTKARHVEIFNDIADIRKKFTLDDK